MDKNEYIHLGGYLIEAQNAIKEALEILDDNESGFLSYEELLMQARELFEHVTLIINNKSDLYKDIQNWKSRASDFDK